MTSASPPTALRVHCSRGRLIAMALAAQLLLLGLTTTTLKSQQQAAIRQLQQDHLSVLTSAYALSFSRVLILDDKDAAADLVVLFESDPTITQAYLYNRQNQPIFRYQSDPKLPSPVAPDNDLPRRIHTPTANGLYVPLSLDGQRFGSAYVGLRHMNRVSDDALWSKLLMLLPVIIGLALLIGWLGCRRPHSR